MFKENKEDFRRWLINQKGLSVKAAADVICRCNRLDGSIIKSIDLSVSSSEHYLIALKEINAYAVLNKKSKETQYSLTGALRAAMRKYCEYINPTKFEQYPTGYSISR